MVNLDISTTSTIFQPTTMYTLFRYTWRSWQDTIRDESERTLDAFTMRAEFELYDLATDPYETRNLAGNRAFKQ